MMTVAMHLCTADSVGSSMISFCCFLESQKAGVQGTSYTEAQYTGFGITPESFADVRQKQNMHLTIS